MKKLIALVLAMAFVVAACSSSSTEDAVSAYCDDLGNLKSSLESLTALTATSTIDDVNIAKDEVKAAYENTVSSAEGVDEAVLNELENAKNDWQEAVDGIPSDATIDEALAAFTAADVAYLAAVDASLTKVSCNA